MFYKSLSYILVMSFCSSCTTNLISDSRQRAKEVFIYHNQLVSQLILISSNVSLSNSQLIELEQAEALMIKACKPLNQIATKVRDGKKTNLGQRINIPSTLNSCEKQTKAVEQLLAEF